MDAANATEGLLRFRRFTWWSMTGGNVLVLAYAAVRLSTATVPAPVVVVLALLWLATVVAVLRLVDGLVPRRRATVPRAWAIVGACGSTGLAAAGLLGARDELWALAPAVVATLVTAYLAAPWRGRVVGGLALAAAVSSAGVHGLADGEVTGYLVVFPAAVVGFVAFLNFSQLWTWDVAARLDEARRVDAELAVAEERLRFAADLHDIQGHHLQVIALKSELARRLVGSDPTTAGEQMGQVQQIALEALGETRTVAQGYRRTTLQAEIANATEVLTSAGIDGRMLLEHEASLDQLPEDCRRLLGLVVREATTNILRHSRATRADLRLDLDDGRAELRISNDGAASPADGDGQGLAGLAERLETAGGTLTHRHDGDRFELRAQLPLPSAAEVRT